MNNSGYVMFGFNIRNIKLEVIGQMMRERGEAITGGLLLNVIVDVEKLFMSEPGGAEAHLVHLSDNSVPDDHVVGNG